AVIFTLGGLLLAFAVALLEARDAPTGVQDLLFAGVEGMAIGTDLDVDLTVALGAAGDEGVAAAAADLRLDIVRVNALLHGCPFILAAGSPSGAWGEPEPDPAGPPWSCQRLGRDSVPDGCQMAQPIRTTPQPSAMFPWFTTAQGDVAVLPAHGCQPGMIGVSGMIFSPSSSPIFAVVASEMVSWLSVNSTSSKPLRCAMR